MDTDHAIRSGKLVRKAHDCHRRSVRLSRDSKKREGFNIFDNYGTSMIEVSDDNIIEIQKGC